MRRLWYKRLLCHLHHDSRRILPKQNQAHGLNVDFEIYKGVDDFFYGPEAMWIYIPIDEDEYITKICQRTGSPHSITADLVVRERRRILFIRRSLTFMYAVRD